MRGKLKYDFTQSKAIGITPAGAGKTAAGLSDCRAGWDHPRRCGENLAFSISFPAERGSPPQVRGKRSEVQLVIVTFGITPAGAGKTLSGVQDFPFL